MRAVSVRHWGLSALAPMMAFAEAPAVRWTVEGAGPRGGCWASNADLDVRWAGPYDVLLDWGDMPAECSTISAFRFAYRSHSTAPPSADIVFYGDEDGFNSTNRTVLGVFRLSGLPTDGVGLATWVITVEADPPVSLASASDVDGDGRKDFGYSLSFRGASGTDTGAVISGEAASAPGAEDAYDWFRGDPNDLPPFGELLLPGVNTVYEGAFFFGTPFAQFYMEALGESSGNGCPQEGCAQADIEPADGDCDVDVGDLAVVLGNFGSTGVSREQGDIDPWPVGDGDVDATDLAVTLTAFGTSCH